MFSNPKFSKHTSGHRCVLPIVVTPEMALEIGHSLLVSERDSLPQQINATLEFGPMRFVSTNLHTRAN